MLVVEPVGDPLRQRLPVGFVGEHALPAQLVELLDAVGLDLLLAGAPEGLLDLDLDRQPMRIPAGNPGHGLAEHRVVPAHHVLDGAGEDVVAPRPAVRGGGAFEEHERRPVAHGLARLLEQPLVLPRGEQLLLEPVDRKLGIEDRIHQLSRSSTPRISAVSRGSAPRATAMICSTDAGASASGRHWSVMIDTPSTRIPTCTAAITSGTVLIPTTSAPSPRSMRYSARVSRLGPATATYTPSRSRIRSSSATWRARARSGSSYGCDMSGKRRPSVSSFGPTSGLSPSRLMWSAMSIRSPGFHSGCMPPQAFETTRMPAPSRRSTRTGSAICWRV